MRVFTRPILIAILFAGCAAPAAPPPAPPPPAPAPAPAPPPPPTPAQARHGTLAAFTSVLRDAIRRRDFAALREMMAPDFTSGFVGPSTPEIAFAAWRSEDYRSLDEAVELLDGLVQQEPELWVAPDVYRTTAGYRGLRTGIGRGADGGWVWLFLVRGEG